VVFPPFNLLFVTAPPAPSPRLPNSSIMPFPLAALQPASSRSSTSSGRPFSLASASRSGSGWLLFSLSIAGAPSLPPCDMAEMGSVAVCSPGKPRVAWYDAADPFAWTSPKLPDLECALWSLDPPADDPVPIRSGGSPRGFWRPSCGVVLEPMGVARRRAGGIGRARLGCTSLEPFTTGLAFGDAGMDRPRRGVRPPLWARPPGTGGRRRGTVADMMVHDGGFTCGGTPCCI
jgi:hypothetical protein